MSTHLHPPGRPWPMGNFLHYRLDSASLIPRTAEGAGPFGNKMVKPAWRPELEIPSRKISLDRSFGHPVRTIGDEGRYRDDGLPGKPNRTRTGFAVRVDKEAEPT